MPHYQDANFAVYDARLERVACKRSAVGTRISIQLHCGTLVFGEVDATDHESASFLSWTPMAEASA